MSQLRGATQFVPASLQRSSTKNSNSAAGAATKQASLQKIKEIEERISQATGTQHTPITDQLGLDLKTAGAYDPRTPNDYETLVKEREARLRTEARERQREDSERRRLERQAREKEEERQRYEAQAKGHVPNIGREREDDAPGASQPVALRIMKESGWKQGHGLGAQGQGMTAALAHEKTGRTTANIVMQQAPPKAPEAPPPKKIKIKGRPTRVIMLRNMVGPGEVDQDLQPEIEEECSKYGTQLASILPPFCLNFASI